MSDQTFIRNKQVYTTIATDRPDLEVLVISLKHSCNPLIVTSFRVGRIDDGFIKTQQRNSGLLSEYVECKRVTEKKLLEVHKDWLSRNRDSVLEFVSEM